MGKLQHGSPLEGQCLNCKLIFSYIIRGQGGGVRKKWCSSRCRSYAWTKSNGEKRKAQVTKYGDKPESKIKRQQYTLTRKLSKYGWTRIEFQKQLQRQNFVCYGCLKPINEFTARIDHDHKSGKIRGLLCDSCNWSLGHLNDDPNILRRLMSYLDYQREKTCIYIVGALKNTRVPELGNNLRKLNYDVMDEWYAVGEFADTAWQEYEKLRGRSYAEALRGRHAQDVFLFDRSYIDLSDIVILLLPAGKSAMLELGYAKGLGKHTCILLDGEDPDRYDIMPNFADEIFKTEENLIQCLTQI